MSSTNHARLPNTLPNGREQAPACRNMAVRAVELCSTERVKRAWTAPSPYIRFGSIAVAAARDLAETTGGSSRLHLRPEAQL
ncbi:hypothetical protein VM1G_11609 [Cytospora mali]|uniref:Uncharacterized protein n=1 Tax=Cytospora mali TaxID=578113 RepID=A0A194VYG1_CYTMA|nr:hypothetical protein VM1G_11609 [Valsa mali]